MWESSCEKVRTRVVIDINAASSSHVAPSAAYNGHRLRMASANESNSKMRSCRTTRIGATAIDSLHGVTVHGLVLNDVDPQLLGRGVGALSHSYTPGEVRALPPHVVNGG